MIIDGRPIVAVAKHARLHGPTSLPSLTSAGRRHCVTPGAIHKEALQRHSRPQSSRQSAAVVTFQVPIFAKICIRTEDMAVIDWLWSTFFVLSSGWREYTGQWDWMGASEARGDRRTRTHRSQTHLNWNGSLRAAVPLSSTTTAVILAVVLDRRCAGCGGPSIQVNLQRGNSGGYPKFFGVACSAQGL